MTQGNSLIFTYDPVADRIYLTLRHAAGPVGVLLTRRLVKVFLSNFADLLEKTAGDANADRRAGVIFEHLEAVRGYWDEIGMETGGGTTKKAASGPRPDTWDLISQINIRHHDDGFEMMLSDGGETGPRLTLSRSEAHRLLSAVYRKAGHAGWDLDPHIGWLAEAGGTQYQSLAQLGHAH